jgi:phosphate transport system protein
MAVIRSIFQNELDGISQSLVKLTEMAMISMSKATLAVLNSDLKLAEEVIADDLKIDELQHEIDDRIIDIIARQQPVASDLRALVTALRMGSDLERMGDLAEHVAKLARRRHPECAVPAELIATVTAMGEAAEKITKKTSTVISTRDIELALQVDKDDDVMDRLHRELIAILIEPVWEHGIEVAIDLTLLGRYYERFADHAVSVSRRVYFLVTGKYA